MKEVKNKALVFVVFTAIFILISVSFASASIFTDLWGKFTGKVISAPQHQSFQGLPLCDTESTAVQYCKEKGYETGKAGAAYSGGQCAEYKDGEWLLYQSNSVMDAKCFNTEPNDTKSNMTESNVTSHWTEWYNRDSPSGSGDWELLSSLGDVCNGQKIVGVECQTTSGVDSNKTGQTVSCSTTSGFSCQNSQNPSGCLDYKVRFECGANNIAPTIGCSLNKDGTLSCVVEKSGVINASLQNVTYVISVPYLDSNEKVKLIVNGENTDTLQIGDSYKLKDGAFVKIIDVLFQSYQGGVDYVKFILSPTSVAEDSCKDSDGGLNYNFKGILSVGNQTIGTDSCLNSTTGTLMEYFCYSNTTINYIFHNCEYGCLDGACKTGSNETYGNISEYPESNNTESNKTFIEPNGTIIFIEPNATTGPIKLNNTESNETTKTSLFCNGCDLDTFCYPLGYRKEGNYCSGNKTFIPQLKSDDSCENNFECGSNVCANGKCVSGSLIQSILDWFSNLFG